MKFSIRHVLLLLGRIVGGFLLGFITAFVFSLPRLMFAGHWFEYWYIVFFAVVFHACEVMFPDQKMPAWFNKPEVFLPAIIGVLVGTFII